MSKNMVLNQKVEDYVKSVKVKSEQLVKNVFPEKIVVLNEILETHFSLKDPSVLHQELNIPVPDPVAISRGLANNHGHDDKTSNKKRKIAIDGEFDLVKNEVDGFGSGTKVLAIMSGPVTSNTHITKLIDVVKPHIRQLVEDTNLLKMWVTFLIPKIEDGNNFGVSIQEDTLGEIRTVEAEAATFYEQISRYFITRGKIISKVAKYPHIEDYRKLIDELDEKEFLSLKIVLSEVRNHYASMYDLINKNFEKIIRPRTSNAENLY